MARENVNRSRQPTAVVFKKLLDVVVMNVSILVLQLNQQLTRFTSNFEFYVSCCLESRLPFLPLLGGLPDELWAPPC